MFSLNPTPKFWSAVKLTIPGEPKPVEIEMQFKHQAVDTLREWVDAARARNDAETICAIVEDWRGVDAECSPANVRLLLQNYPAASGEIFEQYLRALTESRAKN